MGLTDFIVDAAKDKAKDYAVGKAENAVEQRLEKNGKEKLKKDNVVGRFFVSLIWFIVYVLITVIVLLTGVFSIFEFGDFKGTRALTVGIVLSVILILITLVIPYLRRGSWTRWFGFWLPLGDAAWWAYLLFTA